jgi:preprotein translocase subunit SecA
MRIFGSERMSDVLHKLGLPEGEALVHPFISKALEKAQQKVEERNFDIRKSLLKYDDVMNEQRKVIYEQRKEIMSTNDLSETILDMRHDYLAAIANNSISIGTPIEEWDIIRLKQDIFNLTGINLPIENWIERPEINSEELFEQIVAEIDKQITERNSQISDKTIRLVEKSVILQILDQLWKEHIATLDLMRHTIVLRAYGQKDPLNEYKKEAFNMFSEMLDLLKERITTIVCHMVIKENSDQEVKEEERRKQNQKLTTNKDGENEGTNVTNINEWGNTPRNAPCPCGSGKKYKSCCGKL